jgi:exodeoxyribonuclease V alpha subunit
MTPMDSPAPADPLADGLAVQFERWALALGADPALAQRVARVGHAVSRATREGHVCVQLAEAWGPEDPPLRRELLASGVVGTPADPGARPLIVDDEGRVYLHRQFDLERRLARRLVQAARPVDGALGGGVREQLASLFAANRRPGDGAVDWQQVGAALALRQRLAVISGGPGTGKTTTVVNLLGCLLAEDPGCRIALAAPTGKAAARLAEAIRERALHLPEDLRGRLPQAASTVHRLLGVTPTGFVHHAGRPLAIDALVVDEASMLDLALATQLLEAVPAHARIVLLGDQHQLAAVEAGAVFAELGADPTLSDAGRADLEAACGLPPGRLQPPTPLQPGVLHDSVVWFERNFRFAADSAIGRLAGQIKVGRRDETLATLRDADGDELRWWNDAGAQPAPAVRAHIDHGYAAYLDAVRRDPQDAAALAQAFGAFRVLCARREGPRGMAAVNAQMDLRARQVLAPLLARHPSPPGSAAYPGRPVMVLRNQPLLQLFNGDIGFTLPPGDGDEGPVVAFPLADGGMRRVPALRLPEHQSAWAMTVHKSQGSEFDAVLVLLPEARSPVLTRELLYTAVTRARRRVAIAGSAAVVAAAIDTPTRRHSGLTARLREAFTEFA